MVSSAWVVRHRSRATSEFSKANCHYRLCIAELQLIFIAILLRTAYIVVITDSLEVTTWQDQAKAKVKV